MGDADIVAPIADVKDPSEWNFAADLGQPNQIIASVPIDIPANGNDLWHKHYVDAGVTQDRCIKAVQVKPRGDAAAVVHHANSDVESQDENGEWQKYGQLTELRYGQVGRAST